MPLRGALRLLSALVAGSLFVFPGCGDDGATTGDDGCPNCENWTRITTDGGDSPAAHPSLPGIIAYSSRRGDSESENADIWIREQSATGIRYYQVTNDPADEQYPSWSPDGKRIAFSRASQGRRDIWVIDVSSFATPTDLRKVTTVDLVSGSPNHSAWRDDQTLIFTNGDDIYELSLTTSLTQGLVELIPDPSDVILGLGLRFTENQPAFVKTDALTEHLAFISEGRGPQGDVRVTASAETGEEITAIISIDQKPLLDPDRDTLTTPFDVFGIAPGQYVVGVRASGGQDGLCDTSLVKTVFVVSNEVQIAHFVFERPRGAIRVIAPTGQNARILVLFPPPSGVRTDFGTVQAESTLIGCLFEGDYRVDLVAASQLKDSVTVHVCERSISEVCLTTALGGCPGLDSMPCIEPLIYVPSDTGDAGFGDLAESSPIASGKAPPSLQGIASPSTDLWTFSFEDESFVRMTDDNPDQQSPAWSPDGRYLAFIEVTDGIRTLRLANPESRSFATVPLPGRPGTRICNRIVGSPSWTPEGREIVVTLTNCDDEIETGERNDIWKVDVSRFLPP